MIKEIIVTKEFKPFPAYEDRTGWEAIPNETRSFFINRGYELKGKKWENIPATDWLAFLRTGNRSQHYTHFLKNKMDLFTLLLAECIEGKGTFIDDIINGTWLFCEQTCWEAPAHINILSPKKGSFYYGDKRKYCRELPDMEDTPPLDIIYLETGALLAWVYHLLGDVISKITPLVKRRIEIELERRIMTPFLENDDFPWMGFNGSHVNNHNTWINSNILAVFLTLLKIYPGAAEGINKAIRSINNYINSFPDDGGCDEGAHYYEAAFCCVCDFVELLETVTDVSYLYRNQKFINMLSFIRKIHIDKNYFVNFADGSSYCPMKPFPESLLYRAGQKTADSQMTNFAVYMQQHGQINGDELYGHNFLYRILNEIFSNMKNKSSSITGYKAPLSGYLESIQVLTARDYEEPSKGFFFSAKGGHNNEFHNHNDVGNFILYNNGEPVIIDAGVETYSKTTFDNELRYTIWTMRSMYHNLPVINGFEQPFGRQFQAKNTEFSETENSIHFSMDLGNAYPNEAKIEHYHRKFIFKRFTGLEIHDSWILQEFITPVVFNFLCINKPVHSSDVINLGNNTVLRIDNFHVNVEVDIIELKDPKIHDEWRKNEIYHLRLTMESNNLAGTVVLRFVSCLQNDRPK